MVSNAKESEDSFYKNCPPNSVYVFDKASGKRLKVLEEKMNVPRGVAVDTSGFIYVADSRNHRVLKFDKNYHLVHTIKKTKENRVLLDYPYGICIVDRCIYVADRANRRIQMLTLDLEQQEGFGGFIRDNTQKLYDPIGIAFDCKEKVFYVADEGNNTVNKFNEKYEHTGRIREIKGIDPPLVFDKLRGIAVSSQRRLIFVTEPRQDRIVCFNTEGEYVKEAKAWNNRNFINPQVVALDPDDNYLYVGDDSGQLHSIELDMFIKGK